MFLDRPPRTLKDRRPLEFLNISLRCIICNSFDESNKHLFFECSGTKVVWKRVKEWFKIRRQMSTIRIAIKWLAREEQGSGILCKARWVALAASAYHLWHARNKLNFEDAPFFIRGVFKNIQSDVYRVIYSIFPLKP